MLEQRLLSYLRAAIDRYDMLTPFDPPDSPSSPPAIAVGVSGGKDSVTLLWLLAKLQQFHPTPFTVTAITLDPCFGGEPADYSPIAELCDQLKVPYILKRTGLWEVVFRQRQKSNPCSLCARMRRGILHKTAIEAGCRLVALGHHKNDAAETYMMNLLNGATIGCFSPKTHLDRRGITLIRPLIFMEERDIVSFVRQTGLPVVKSKCPIDGCTNRQRMKNLLAELSAGAGTGTPSNMADTIVKAMQKAGISGW